MPEDDVPARSTSLYPDQVARHDPKHEPSRVPGDACRDLAIRVESDAASQAWTQFHDRAADDRLLGVVHRHTPAA
jgi:hypothetical protein